MRLRLGALPQTLLGELTALLQTPSWIWGGEREWGGKGRQAGEGGEENGKMKRGMKSSRTVIYFFHFKLKYRYLDQLLLTVMQRVALFGCAVAETVE